MTVVDGPIILITVDIETVSVLSTVIVSPADGTFPVDQVDGAFQSPLFKEFVLAENAQLNTSKVVTNGKMNSFIGARLMGSL